MQSYHKELVVIVLIYVIWALAILGLLWIVAGCTFVTVSPPPNNDAGHTNVMTMPSVSTCLLAACDIVTSDRASRAGEDLQNKNDLKADQAADVKADVGLKP